MNRKPKGRERKKSGKPGGRKREGKGLEGRKKAHRGLCDIGKKKKKKKVAEDTLKGKEKMGKQKWCKTILVEQVFHGGIQQG